MMAASTSSSLKVARAQLELYNGQSEGEDFMPGPPADPPAPKKLNFDMSEDDEDEDMVDVNAVKKIDFGTDTDTEDNEEFQPGKEDGAVSTPTKQPPPPAAHPASSKSPPKGK